MYLRSCFVCVPSYRVFTLRLSVYLLRCVTVTTINAVDTIGIDAVDTIVHRRLSRYRVGSVGPAETGLESVGLGETGSVPSGYARMADFLGLRKT